MRRTCSDGFTLIELVVALTLVSLLAMVAVPMLRLPMSAYLDAANRVELGAAAEVATARLAQDLGQALHNSVRVRQVGARVMLEYLELRAHGRYRNGASGAAQSCPAVCSAPGANDVLEFACSEACFTSLGPLMGSAPVPGSDYVVINPRGPGVPGGDPYFGGAAVVAGGIKSRLLGVAPVAGGSRVTITPHSFALAAPSKRFYVVATPVSYECDPGTQRLTRYWGYPIAATQPVVFAGAQSAPLATQVSACRIRYDTAGTGGRGGVVSVWLRFTQPAAGTGVAESFETFSEFAVSEAA